MAKRDKDREVYNNIVLQGCEVRSGPEDSGFLTLSTVNSSFTVILNHAGAEQIIKDLQDFIKGRAPSFARDDN